MMRFGGVFVFCFLILILISRVTFGDKISVSNSGKNICPIVSLSDSILGFPDFVCDRNRYRDLNTVSVIEGDEVSLLKALHLVNSLNQNYVAVLFYASWCPFSRNFRPSFSALASLYPSIPHFAIEESAIRPSILSKYGVHGFPTLFLLNSTIRVHYRGSRSLASLAAFYGDVTGVKSNSREQLSLSKTKGLSNHLSSDIEPENCPFSWARSPENMLRQETYLALAATFMLMRLLYFLLPYIVEFGRQTWRRYILHVRIGTLLEHPMRCLNRAKQLFNFMKEPCKGSNFPEGAMNARAWASKSLASAVAIGNASTSRGATGAANH